ncbi:hypothetical protein [Streptomyces bambusae]|uniref:Integral membrane protein n=1 Tax=Streptomyces bambusae TaxID=1550616 RepID=A0ABS6Z8V7_9ACTN|nr:hypothetical protein [Streptomyces bambusae]MBW5484198.1 hypothetical protein [Streptomyces bambusae]
MARRGEYGRRPDGWQPEGWQLEGQQPNGRQPDGWQQAGANGAGPYGPDAIRRPDGVRRPDAVRRPGPAAAGRNGTERHGCATALMAPFVLAARTQRPARPDRLADPAIAGAQVARTGIGLAATVWLFYAFTLREDAEDVFNDKLAEVLISAGVLLIVGPLAVAAFVVSARPPLRARYRQRLRGPVTAFGCLFGAAVLQWIALRSDVRDQLFAWAGDIGFVLGLVLGLASFFLLPFVLTSSVLCVHHAFRTADVHEVLPPLLSPVVVVVMSVLQAVDGPPVNAPQSVWFAFLAGAPLTVTALSVWELRRLRNLHGITLRAALGR